MDEQTLDAARDELLAWGLLERSDTGLSWTRRFRGAVMREAGRLADEERAGRRAEGAPLAVAAGAALRELQPGATETHARLLVAVELAALPEAVRNVVS